MSLFDSMVSLATSVVKIGAAPIEVVVDLADAALQPVVDAAKELTKDVKSLKD